MDTKRRRRIAYVDDNMTNLAIGRNMLKEHYEVYPIRSGKLLLEKMDQIKPDLILLDIDMPGMDGYETLRRLKKRYDLFSTPVVFLTALDDLASELIGLNLGAVDYISKPFSPPLLMKRIENHILMGEQSRMLKYLNANLEKEVQKKTERVYNLQNTMLVTVTEMIEFRDNATGGHIERTQSFMQLLIDDLVSKDIYTDIIKQWDLELLLLSAPLHDTGKIAISDTILNKPGKLTAAEFEIMKKHVDFGVVALEHIEKNTYENSFLQYAKPIAGTHHEKWDGSGYPNGLAGQDIPLEGRLMAVADVYDALISKRPYKKAFGYDKAKQIIIDGRGTHFDPALVDAFTRVERQFRKVAENFDWASTLNYTRLAS